MEKNRLQFRKTNIELLRIVLMLMIIAHHYVVNSGLTELYNYQNPTLKMYFFQCFGAFGKIGVNCFVLITGYFMITSSFSFKKWLKLYLEVKFYSLLIYFVFLAFGGIEFNYHGFLENLFGVVFGIGTNYAETFLVLYLLIPFLNMLAKNLNFRMYSIMLGILLVVMTMIPSFSLFLSIMDASNDTWNYLLWMIVMYLLGGYIRTYGHQLYERAHLNKTKAKAWFFVCNLLLIFIWIAFYDLFGAKYSLGSSYWFVNDANKLLALTCSISMLILFLSFDIKHSKLINGVAATTFGVFLIHTSGDYMRSFLWGTVFNVTETYQSPNAVIKAIISVALVFVGCAVIDYLRMQYLEKPLFDRLENCFFKKKDNTM